MVDCGGRAGRSFAPERADESPQRLRGGGRARARPAGRRQARRAGRLVRRLARAPRRRARRPWPEARRAGVRARCRRARWEAPARRSRCSGLEQGFETDDLAVISEQDILGDRLVRKRKNAKRAANFLTEIGSLSEGDIVVHAAHGIARFTGLKPIEAGGVPHDCLELHYADGAKLFLPVENLELLSRYGSEDAEAPLDRLGGAGWQKRKARMRKRVLEMAAGLMKIAAARLTREAAKLIPPDGAYEEFAAGFPYDETEDQRGAIDAVLDDMGSGKPMDRLICGDVGFGKTEVALRAAFTAAINGKQVALIVPTTLLARQHFKNFHARFAHMPIKVAQLSRMVGLADLKAARAGLASGDIDIVVGTHAVLGKGVDFKDLGLVIVDEEQHFGVKHKERLKDMRAEVHVLTLSATPIPRTLQLAMTGVRDLSIIATPPVDRLAVRTFVTPFDELLVREALLRERYRGGQSFYVCPRIEFLDDALAFLRRERAGGQGRRRARADAAERAGGEDVGLLRGQVRHPAVDDDHRIGPRHPHRQHADRAPRRHVRPVAALPAARPRRALQDAGLRAVHPAGEQDGDGAGGAAAQGARHARHAGRRLPARQPRPRHPRRRQPVGPTNNPATSRKSGSNSTRRCCRRRSRRCSSASRSRRRKPGRRRSRRARR